MGIGDLMWGFFIVSALQPVIKQRLLEASRYRLIAKIEQRRGSRVILLVHRQETMSFLGFPLMRSSTLSPQIHSDHMLPMTCIHPPCRNMLVTNGQ